MSCRLIFIAIISLLAAHLEAAPSKVTFYHDIAPVVYGNCVTCHRPGGAGPFSLITYDDVRRHAGQIADVTKRRYMPPWLPEPGHGEFEEERRLTDAQIELIQTWVKQGSLAGSSAKAPRPPPSTPNGNWVHRT